MTAKYNRATAILADLALGIAESETHWRNHDFESASAALRTYMAKTVELRPLMSELTAENIQLALIQAVAHTRSVAAPDHVPSGDRAETRRFVRETYHHAMIPDADTYWN